MLPHEHIQPSDKAEHIAIVIELSQAVFGMSFNLVPDIPFVECNFDRFCGESKVDPVDLGEVNE
jgi:hypothetical protein